MILVNFKFKFLLIGYCGPILLFNWASPIVHVVIGPNKNKKTTPNMGLIGQNGP